MIRMAPAAAALPQEAAGDPADVLARYYFEAAQAKVLKVAQLRQRPEPAEGLSTVEIEIDAAGTGYTLGGTLAVLPENSPEDVAAMLPLLGLLDSDLDKFVTFTAAEGPNRTVKKPFPTPCRLREALFRYCDLARAPSKKMLTSLQPTLKDETARERLAKLLADPEALKQLQAHDLCCRMHEFWRLAGVTSLSLGDFLLHCPRQKPREFTIASSPTASPDRLALCVSLTSHEPPPLGVVFAELQARGIFADCQAPAPERSRFFGLASHWLTTRAKAGDTLLVKHRASALHLPQKDVPVVMVGAGAGVAPFRGFWEEIRRSARNSPAALFFGCRHPDKDWLYKTEMNAAVKLAATGCVGLQRLQQNKEKKPLAALFPCFSRPDDAARAQYVQKAVNAQSRSVKHWVEKMDGSVFICGSSAMGMAVLEELAQVLEGGKPTVDALRKEGRIVAEMWG